MGTYNLGYVKGADGQSGTWVEEELTNPSATFALFVNSTLRLCELRMHYIPLANITTVEDHYTDTKVPSTYAPSGVVVGPVQVRTGGSLRVNSQGDIVWTNEGNISSESNVYGSVMWHY